MAAGGKLKLLTVLLFLCVSHKKEKEEVFFCEMGRGSFFQFKELKSITKLPLKYNNYVKEKNTNTFFCFTGFSRNKL